MEIAITDDIGLARKLLEIKISNRNRSGQKSSLSIVVQLWIIDGVSVKSEKIKWHKLLCFAKNLHHKSRDPVLQNVLIDINYELRCDNSEFGGDSLCVLFHSKTLRERTTHQDRQWRLLYKTISVMNFSRIHLSNEPHLRSIGGLFVEKKGPSGLRSGPPFFLNKETLKPVLAPRTAVMTTQFTVDGLTFSLGGVWSLTNMQKEYFLHTQFLSLLQLWCSFKITGLPTGGWNDAKFTQTEQVLEA